MSGTKDYYADLGLRRDATPDDIKKAYKKLALKVHPDKNKNKAKAEEQFKKIGEAYKILSNPQTKLMFDRELAAADMKAKVEKAASAKAKAEKAARDRQERAAPAYAKARDENETRTGENRQNTGPSQGRRYPSPDEHKAWAQGFEAGQQGTTAGRPSTPAEQYAWQQGFAAGQQVKQRRLAVKEKFEEAWMAAGRQMQQAWDSWQKAWQQQDQKTSVQVWYEAMTAGQQMKLAFARWTNGYMAWELDMRQAMQQTLHEQQLFGMFSPQGSGPYQNQFRSYPF